MFPYTFSLDEFSHQVGASHSLLNNVAKKETKIGIVYCFESFDSQLTTMWEVSGTSVSFLCAFGTFSVIEIDFNGKQQEVCLLLGCLGFNLTQGSFEAKLIQFDGCSPYQCYPGQPPLSCIRNIFLTIRQQ